MIIIGAALTVGLIVLALQYRSRTRVALYPDEQQTRLAILERVPIGTSSAIAREVMEKAGFRCELRENASFARRDAATGRLKRVEGQSFLYCDREKVVWWKFRNHRWQVILVVPNGKVEDIVVSFGVIAP